MTYDAWGARRTGSDRLVIPLLGAPVDVFTYRPESVKPRALLILFHGRRRRAYAMRDVAQDLAEELGFAVLAPHLDETRFPNWRYHRAGVERNGEIQSQDVWSAPLVKDLIEGGRHWIERDSAPYVLYGHSAGAQFLSRTSAYCPPIGASRIVLANPSLYTLPSLDESAPYGFSEIFKPDIAEGYLKQYLALPISIYVGDQDTGEKDLVSHQPGLQHSTNRFERGVSVYALAKNLAAGRAWEFNWQLVVAPGIGHASDAMLRCSAIWQSLDLPHWQQT